MQSHAYKECSSVGGLVTPVTRDALGKLVVASETVDARLNKNETELGVLVLAVLFQMLTHGDDHLDLGDTVGIPEDHTDLGWSESLLGHGADLLHAVGGALLDPGWGRPLVREGAAGNALSFAVHTTHDCLCLVPC